MVIKTTKFWGTVYIVPEGKVDNFGPLAGEHDSYSEFAYRKDAVLYDSFLSGKISAEEYRRRAEAARIEKMCR